MIFIERNLRRTTTQRILHTLCLLLPVGSAFLGYFAAPYLYKHFYQSQPSELFKFFCSLGFFIVPSVIIFIMTRKTDPVMKIEVTDNKQKP